MITRKGISASPGVAIGPALVLDTEEYRIPRRPIDAAEVPQQIQTLDAALDAAREEVAQLRLAASRKLGNQTAAIFAFHESLIADPKLRTEIANLIESGLHTAAFAFGQSMKLRQQQFSELNDTYLKERVRDLADIEKRVLRHILGREREDITRLSEPVIVVTHDMAPSTLITLDRAHILGVATNVGGQTSHTAIIARSLGTPAVVGLESITGEISGGETIIVDGTRGVVIINPDEDTIARFSRLRQRDSDAAEALGEIRDLPAVTLDDQRVQLLANIELADEAREAIRQAAEGIGLYRTEFLFLASDRLPSEAEQMEVFRGAIRHADGRSIVIRTMDVGSDKMTHHLGQHHDANPDLGLRSMRYCLQHLDMFKTHLRAILRSSANGDVWIMFPMITTLMELRAAKAIVADVMEDLDEEDIPYRRDMPIGMMVETPAAAMLSSAFAAEVDFMSIGTNDLTQYTLAVDRSNERVAHLYAPHNPAVLMLIREVVRAGRKRAVPVSLCGEMAGTPLYCQLLLGLGLRQLSMAPKEIPVIKRLIRMTSMRRCEAIARKALKFDAERQIINLLRDELRKIDPESD
jgi:phosphotransferase system enzyme I (PtsI)